MTKIHYYILLCLGGLMVLLVNEFFYTRQTMLICFGLFLLYANILRYLRARHLKMSFIDFLWTSIPIFGAKEDSRIIGE